MEYIQVEAHSIFQPRETAVVEETDLQSQVAQGRAAEHVAVASVARHLFQAKIFVFSRTIKDDIAVDRHNLGHPDNVPFKIAEHFVRLSGNRVTLDATQFAEEQHRALLLIAG